MTVVNSLNRDRLMHRLGNTGLEPGAILEFVWVLKSLLIVDPEMDSHQINRQLDELGWSNLQLDDQTIDLAVECFGSDSSFLETQTRHGRH